MQPVARFQKPRPASIAAVFGVIETVPSALSTVPKEKRSAAQSVKNWSASDCLSGKPDICQPLLSAAHAASPLW